MSVLTIDPSILSVAWERAARLAANHTEYGLTPHLLVGVTAASIDPGDQAAVSAAYLSLGMVLRHSEDAFVGPDRVRATQALADLRGALTPEGLRGIPLLCQNLEFWTGRVDPQVWVNGGSFEALLVDPRFQSYWEEVVRTWRTYQAEGCPRLLEALAGISGWLSKKTEVLTGADFAELHTQLMAMVQPVRQAGNAIGGVFRRLRQEHEAGLSETDKHGLAQLETFLTHDISYMVPWVWEINNMVKCYPMGSANPPVLRLASQMVRTLLQEEYRNTLCDVLSFPLGIISDLHGLAHHRPPLLEEVNRKAVAVVSTTLVALRLLPNQLKSRVALQREGLQPELQFVVQEGSLVTGREEGFFVSGPPDVRVRTYKNLAIAIDYNAIKNSIFATADHYGEEDPEPMDGDHDADQSWNVRQATRVARAKIRFEVEVGHQYRGRSLRNVGWLCIQDTAGGFPLNNLLTKMHKLIGEILCRFTGATQSDLLQVLADLRVADLAPLLDRLQKELGLSNRQLVERLFRAFLNPYLMGYFTVQEIMEMAAALRISSRDRDDSFTASGFGLFGINTLSPSAAALLMSFLVPDGDYAGTRTVIPAQSLDGLLHSADALRSLVEAG